VAALSGERSRWLCHTQRCAHGTHLPQSPTHANVPSLRKQAAVNAMFEADAASISANPLLPPDAKREQLDNLTSQRGTFESLFDESAYEELRTRGDRRFSYKAMQAVRQEPRTGVCVAEMKERGCVVVVVQDLAPPCQVSHQ